MKLIHLSDLHLGKRVNEFSMIEDQKYVLMQVIDIIKNEKADGVLIAGDIYDKNVPSAEAVMLYDDFLTKLVSLKVHVFIISGNHDSQERIAFGGRVMSAVNIHIAPVFSGKMEKYTLTDEYGEVDIYSLPFIKPFTVRKFYSDETASEEKEIVTYTDAVRSVIAHSDIDKTKRNIILSHQFVTGAERCDSEDISVGGLDNVDSDVYSMFDYVALGHIHGAQNVKSASNAKSGQIIRYCGTLLKYSFSEKKHIKSVTVVELTDSVTVRTVPVKPLHDMREIKGTYEDITLRDNYINTQINDYMHVTLTDEEDIMDALSRLRSIYPNIMKLDYDNTRTRNNREIGVSEEVETKSPIELFSELFELQNNKPLNDEQIKYLTDTIESL